jgi:hypothetical protein
MLLFGRLPGFDPDHPNAVKRDGVWRNYGWPRFTAKVRPPVEGPSSRLGPEDEALPS